MFGYKVNIPIPLQDLKHRLPNLGIGVEQVASGQIFMEDEAGNHVWAHADQNSVTYFWRTAGNDASSIMQKIADAFGQQVFSDTPEYYGDDPLYSPAPSKQP